MGDVPSRGRALSGYLPNVDGASGVAVHFGEMRAQHLTGQILCADVVYAVTHQLGEAPKFILIQPSMTAAEAGSASVINVALADEASATTSTKFYVCGTKAGLPYAAVLFV